jgi:hypothetical protein
MKVNNSGVPGAIRTLDPLLRRQLLYPTELQAQSWEKSRQRQIEYNTTAFAVKVFQAPSEPFHPPFVRGAG